MNDDFTALKYRNLQPKRLLALRLGWELVWLFLFRPTPRWSLHGWRRMLLRLFGARIGSGCRIAPTCFVWAPWNLEMGALSVLGDGVDCYSMDKITLGSKVAVSQRSFLCTGTHDSRLLTRPLVTAPITVGNHVWIAAESMVMPGVAIGEGAVVGARSLVTRDLPPWMVCAGHPCKPLRPRDLSRCEQGSAPDAEIEE